MNTYKVLTKIYETWGEINRISPLPSADDLRFDAQYGRTSLTNKQFQWLGHARVAILVTLSCHKQFQWLWHATVAILVALACHSRHFSNFVMPQSSFW